jgi:phospholipid/cholesterol/gamma-HCH transport system substrate-binding protein
MAQDNEGSTASTGGTSSRMDSTTSDESEVRIAEKDPLNKTEPDADAAEPEAAAPEPMVTGRDRNKRLFRAGIFTLLGFLILIVGVFVIGDKKNLFTSTFPVYTNFTTVEGLKSGAPVMFNGLKIGTVSNVALQLGDTSSFVRVDMVLDGAYRQYVRSSTVATIGQAGLIGDKLIQFNLTDVSAPIVQDGAYLKSVQPVDVFAIVDESRAVVRQAENITASLDTLLLRFRRGEGTLGKFLTDDRAYNALVDVSTEAGKLFNTAGQQLSGVSASLNHAVGNVDEMSNEGRRLIADIGKGKGTVGALLYDRSLYDSLEVLTSSFSRAANSAGFAAQEFGLNMRGLRSNWLVGGLFGGGEEEKDIDLERRLLQIRAAELERQRQLLEQREREIMAKEADGVSQK